MNSQIQKKPIATIRLTLLARSATPSPILGQALGQYGINIMEFCKNFNNQTKNIKERTPVPALVAIYSNGVFETTVKTPSNTYLLKKAANISKGSSMPKKNNLEEAYIYPKEIYHLAVLKACDRLMNHLNLKSICKTLIGSAKSMGLGLRPSRHLGPIVSQGTGQRPSPDR
jgi:large subunit ribosomal protein L11